MVRTKQINNQIVKFKTYETKTGITVSILNTSWKSTTGIKYYFRLLPAYDAIQKSIIMYKETKHFYN